MLSCCPENFDVDSPPLFLLGLCWLAVCSPKSHVNHKWAKPEEKWNPRQTLGVLYHRHALRHSVCPVCYLSSKHKTGVTAVLLNFFALFC